MNIKITKIKEIQVDLPVIYLAEKEEDLKDLSFSPTEFEYIKKQASDKKTNIKINSYPKWSYIQWVNTEKEQHIVKEKLRRAAGKLYSDIKTNKHSKILVVDLCNNTEYTLAFTEGLALSHYQFLKYYSKPEEKENHLEEITNFFYKDYDINELMQYIFNSSWFYDEDNIGVKIKSPIELLIGIQKTVPIEFEKKKLRIIAKEHFLCALMVDYSTQSSESAHKQFAQEFEEKFDKSLIDFNGNIGQFRVAEEIAGKYFIY